MNIMKHLNRLFFSFYQWLLKLELIAFTIEIGNYDCFCIKIKINPFDETNFLKMSF